MTDAQVRAICAASASASNALEKALSLSDEEGELQEEVDQLESELLEIGPKVHSAWEKWYKLAAKVRGQLKKQGKWPGG
jgi:chromosome condensin MukBEF ATPase and DNA-binding subunit MukB